MFGRKEKNIIEGGDGSSSAAPSVTLAGKEVSSPEPVDLNGTLGGGEGGGSSGLPNGGSATAGLISDGLIDPKKLGTRVFKKSSPNGKITTYLGKRDFLDHGSHIDPIDGVVLIDPEYLKDRKVHAHVLAAFRYGREDLDVLGLTFRKDLFLATYQVYPQVENYSRPLTRLQERLIKKLGSNAFPFFFEMPANTPASVTLQPAPGDTGKPCGVDYELKTYVSDPLDQDKPHKRSSVRLAIRKLTYAPATPLAPQPFVEESQAFLMSPAPLHMECSLDKEMYYHGESITVNVLINNNSNKTVKKIKITVRQYAEICLFSTAQYKCPVAELEAEDGFPLGPSTQTSKVFSITPVLDKEKRGLALDGKLKHEDTNLASSTLVKDPGAKENLGIIVSYKVKVRLIISMGQDVSVEIPFTLTHPKPDEPPSSSGASRSTSIPVSTTATESIAPNSSIDASSAGAELSLSPAVDTNLIQLDDEDDDDRRLNGGEDDDFIFEDFARLRLKGHDNDEVDA